jgi:hypothetical protein
MSSSRTGTGHDVAAGRWTNPSLHPSRSSDHAVGERQTPGSERPSLAPPSPAPPESSPPVAVPPFPAPPLPDLAAVPPVLLVPPRPAKLLPVPPRPAPVPPLPALGPEPPSPLVPPDASLPFAPFASPLSDFPAHDVENPQPKTTNPSARPTNLLPSIEDELTGDPPWVKCRLAPARAGAPSQRGFQYSMVGSSGSMNPT